MGKMDPAQEEKRRGQTNAGKEEPENEQAKNNLAVQSNPDGKGINPDQKGPAQPSKTDDAT